MTLDPISNNYMYTTKLLNFLRRARDIRGTQQFPHAKPLRYQRLSLAQR